MSILRADSLRTLPGTSITASYQVLGAVLSHSWRAWRIINNTDGDLLFSFDGTTDNLFVPAFSFVLYDVAANSAPSNQIDNLVMGLQTQYYVKYKTQPTKGDVWLEGVYAKGQ